jgi:very-short-patch-repair endonuclease
MDPLEFLTSLGGVARVGTLRREGYSDRAVRNLAKAGASQPRKGVWALPGADPGFLQAIVSDSRVTCLADVDAIAMVQSAMTRHGLPLAVPEAELTAKYYGPARKRLAKADGMSESVPEISARLLFESAGFRFDRQVQIAGVGRVDFLIDGWLIVEINGFEFHSSRAAWRKDMSRSNIAQTQAYAVLSYAPEQIWNNPDMVLKEIHAVLKRGRPRG